MALDFPNAPVPGQTYQGPGGIVWTWDGTKWMSPGTGAPVPLNNDVGRNLVHNALFNIQQRGQGPWTVSGSYTADRWVMAVTNDTLSFGTAAAADADRTAVGDEAMQNVLSANFTGNAAATSYSILMHRIENVRRLGGKTITVSFWAAASAALRFGVSFSQVFGNGGSPSANVDVNGQSLALTASAWVRYTLTFTLPSTTGKTLGTNGNDYTQLTLWYSAGSTFAVQSGGVPVQSGSIVLWGVQLEIGSAPTPLEKLNPRMDLANAQRFFCTGALQLYGYGTIADAAVATMQNLPVSMRAAPTMAVTPTNPLNASDLTATMLDTASVLVYCVATAIGTVNVYMTYTATADL